MLPRSALLAAWGSAALSGGADVDAAVKVVTGDDEPHLVAAADHASPGLPLRDGAALGELLALLAAAGVGALRVVLPSPGDVLGLPGPPAFNTLALDAGECVLLDTGGASYALVPEVTEFGSVYEPGAMVTWRVHPVNASRVTDFGSVAEADQELRVALDAATRELARLDVARWREDAAERLALIRDGGVDPGLLPADTPPRCLRVIATAARVRAIVSLATEDDGGAVTGYEATARTEALRNLDRVSRRAVVAAVNGSLEPTR